MDGRVVRGDGGVSDGVTQHWGNAQGNKRALYAPVFFWLC